MGEPKIEDGFDFEGNRIRTATLDLNDPKFDEQLEKLFRDHNLHVGPEDTTE